VGVPPGSPAAATTCGRQLCDRISEVGFDPLVGVVNHENISAGLTIGAALSNYCLGKVSLLPKDLKY
jgi:hypothetical protein